MYSCYVQPRYKNKLDERILSQLIEKSPLRNLVSYRIPKLLSCWSYPGHTKDVHSILPGEYKKVVEEFKRHQQQYYNNTTVPSICFDASKNGFGNKIRGLLSTLTLSMVTGRVFMSIQFMSIW